MQEMLEREAREREIEAARHREREEKGQEEKEREREAREREEEQPHKEEENYENMMGMARAGNPNTKRIARDAKPFILKRYSVVCICYGSIKLT